MLDFGGFVTSQEFLAQLGTFFSTLLTGLVQAILGGLGT